MSKVTTKNPVRLSYTNLLTPRAQDSEKPDVLTYSTAILIPKSDTDTVKAVQAAIKEALAEGVIKKWAGKTPNGLRNPLRDGDADRPDDEVYAGMWFINAKGPKGGQEKPILLDSKGNLTDSTDDIYSGVEARVQLQFFAYDKAGNRGVGASVSSVLSLGVGEPLANAVTESSARNEFGISTPASKAAADFAGDKPTAEAVTESDDSDPWAS